MFDETLFHRVAIEAGDGAEATGDGCPRPSLPLQITAEGLNVGAARTEQREVMFCAPCGELTQVQCVCLSGQAGVAGQEAGECDALGAGEERVVVHDGGGAGLELHGGASFEVGGPS